MKAKFNKQTFAKVKSPSNLGEIALSETGAEIIGEIDTTHTELMIDAMPSFVSLKSATRNIHGIYLLQYIHKKEGKS